MLYLASDASAYMTGQVVAVEGGALLHGGGYIFHSENPDTCPVCTRAREKGEGFLYEFVKLEEHICPACRSHKKVFGVPAHEKIKKK